MKRLLPCLLLAVSATACGGNGRSILYAGIQNGPVGARITISDAEALSTGRTAFAGWKAGLYVRAARAPRQRFTKLKTSAFLAELHTAAARYGFRITSLRFYHSRQFAPSVRVQTRQYLRLSRAIPTITRSLDPHRGSSDLTGYSYEGFYFEADDERGIPFTIVSNLTRGQVEVSQWARSDKLYPFAHG